MKVISLFLLTMLFSLNLEAKNSSYYLYEKEVKKQDNCQEKEVVYYIYFVSDKNEYIEEFTDYQDAIDELHSIWDETGCYTNHY